MANPYHDKSNGEFTTGPSTADGHTKAAVGHQKDIAKGQNPFDAVAAKYPQVRIDGGAARTPDDYAVLSKIEVPKELRGQGLAQKAMQDIVDAADKSGTNLALTPSGDFGSSVPRLKKFYSGLGFVPNSGKNKDFATREAMIRPAKKKS